MSGQRDFMKRLWKDFDGDRKRVIQAFVHAESTGIVSRKSNKSKLSSEEYARRLLDDGLRKGWLESKFTKENETQSEVAILHQPTMKSFFQTNSIVNGNSSQKINWIRNWFQQQRIQPETEEYLERIEAWRLAWKPKRVRVLLVAESHVREQQGDLNVSVSLPRNLFVDKSLPKGFCRLVYCLGYGENKICLPNKLEKNSGTRQYWNLLGSIASGINASINSKMPLFSRSSIFERLKWKIDVLNLLADSGIWLQDASVIGIYASGMRLVNGNNYQKLIRESYIKFIFPEIENDNPDQVWVIGRGVGKALEGLPRITPDKIISQPQDRNNERYQLDLERLVSKVI